MSRDITMIFSVLISIISLIFGVYKNVEAGNAKTYALRQAYQIMGVVDDSNISATAKATILNGALSALGTPLPVLDFSSSDAGAPTPVDSCTDQLRQTCLQKAAAIGRMNMTCRTLQDTQEVCSELESLKDEIDDLSCVRCFTY